MEKEKWIADFYKLYMEGRAKNIATGLVDYFEVRSFISDLLDNQRKSILAEIEQWAKQNKELSSFKLEDKELSEKMRMYHYAIQGKMEDLESLIKLIKEK